MSKSLIKQFLFLSGTEFVELSGQSKFEIMAGLVKSCNQYMDVQATFNPLLLLKSCAKYAV